MKENCWDLNALNDLIDRVLVKYVESLYEINVSMQEATEYVKSKMPSLKAWGESFLLARPSVCEQNISSVLVALTIDSGRFSHGGQERHQSPDVHQ